jgi:hypothetical protein
VRLPTRSDRVASDSRVSRHSGKEGGATLNRRSTIGLIAGVLATTVLSLAPQAQARDSAKFKVLSISGTTTAVRQVVYEPSFYGSCSFTQTEDISFHSTKRATAYAFTSKAHGRARVAWSSKPNFTSNFTVVEVPGEVTVSRSATYQQTYYTDPDTGETTPGCYQEPSPVDCSVERTLPATLEIGGTSGSDESTYVLLSMRSGDLNQLDDACLLELFSPPDDPGLFARADLFRGGQKRLADTDRVETPAFDNPSDDATATGTTVEKLTAELKRKKKRRR